VAEVEVGDNGPFGLGDEVQWTLGAYEVASDFWPESARQSLIVQTRRSVTDAVTTYAEVTAGAVVAYVEDRSEVTTIEQLVRGDVELVKYAADPDTGDFELFARTAGVVRRIQRVDVEYEAVGGREFRLVSGTSSTRDVDRTWYDAGDLDGVGEVDVAATQAEAERAFARWQREHPGEAGPQSFLVHPVLREIPLGARRRELYGWVVSLEV
jgi:hypothetical protein